MDSSISSLNHIYKTTWWCLFSLPNYNYFCTNFQIISCLFRLHCKTCPVELVYVSALLRFICHVVAYKYLRFSHFCRLCLNKYVYNHKVVLICRKITLKRFPLMQKTILYKKNTADPPVYCMYKWIKNPCYPKIRKMIAKIVLQTVVIYIIKQISKYCSVFFVQKKCYFV